MNFKQLISSVNSWHDFRNALQSKTNLEKGNAFEELTKYYLAYNPVYKSKLKSIWLQKEIPSSVIKKLNLPLNDQGIDLIAETHDGDYWAIQCKYLQDEDQKLSHRKISTFISLSKGIAENISYCLVCTTVDEYANLYKGKKNIGFCNSSEWNKLDKAFFDWARKKISGKEKHLVAFRPKPHQAKAIIQAKDYFIKKKNKRGKLVFPCGAGKSLTGYWLTKSLNSKSIIVAVPSLSLVKQTLEVYLRESVANKEKIESLCVCSDEGIGKNDDIVVHTQDIGVPCLTDKKEITDWIKKHRNKKTVIFTTYQSGRTVAEAAHTARFKFDVGILDEAHKTVGDKNKMFSHLLFEKNISIARRIYMTATERRYAGSSDTILSMDDPKMYGETFAALSFKEAIAKGILSDYKIITLFISDEEVKQLIEKNAFVRPAGKEWDKETEARTLASLIALRKAMDEYPIHHAVSFHSSISKSKSFEESQHLFSKAYPKFTKVDAFHVSGAMPTAVRSKIVDEFANSKRSLITNARCLTEGVDVPDIDCVLFADPRKSSIDIVQAVGRALRKKKGKRYGYVLLPVFAKSKTKESIIESAEFNEVLTTLRALASNDERIIEYFRAISKGNKPNSNNSPITFQVDEKVADLINAKELINSLQLTAWNKLAKLSWMPFEEAREFAISLKLKSQKEWYDFMKSQNRPADIPAIVDRVYKGNGWKSWGDFLGTGRIADQLKIFCSYSDAKKHTSHLNLKSRDEWKRYCDTGKKPSDIPFAPNLVYHGEGWKGWGDFLGTGRIADQLKVYWNYKKAKSFISKLNLKSVNEWRGYCKAGKKPSGIPNTPYLVYKNKGWQGWSDFLGIELNERTINPKSYIEARSILRKLKIKSVKEWRRFPQAQKRSLGLPGNPYTAYMNKGWKSWPDFLGIEILNYRDYASAKKYARELNLKSYKQWVNHCKSGKHPADVPVSADRFYKGKGWISWADFLGTNNIKNIQYLDFERVKTFAIKLKLKTGNEWKEYCRAHRSNTNIPSKPERIYAKKGWKDWGDFLGTGNIANYNKVYRSYELARTFVQSLKLKTRAEWIMFTKSGEKPDDIPSYPEGTYANKGWKGIGDWLGTERIAPQNRIFRPFKDARNFVGKLKLKNTSYWIKYIKSNRKPIDIPTNPPRTYKLEWKGWVDFLGTRNFRGIKWRKFDDARTFVKKLKLKSVKDWYVVCQGNLKPVDIPRNPDREYKEVGWKGWTDFLGKE